VFEKKLYGLIGFPLGHSFSRKYFTTKFKKEKLGNCVYRNFPLEEIDDLHILLKSYSSLRGLNVTIPYKEAVIPYLEALDPAARAIGAVNTVLIDRSRLIGYNTDHVGFIQALAPLLRSHHCRALVLGTGGSSKAVQYALQKRKMVYLRVSRSRQKGHLTYDDLTPEIIQKHQLIINTTPLGMHPNVEAAPKLPYQALTPNHLLFDLIYNPAETLFMKKGREQGATVSNGLRMLELEAAWTVWSRVI